jgi:hypothetical protein
LRTKRRGRLTSNLVRRFFFLLGLVIFGDVNNKKKEAA